jgi:hypothetical protein
MASSSPGRHKEDVMIEGLRLTITGSELRGLLDDRIRRRELRVAWYEKELKRTLEDQTEEEPLLPEHMLENERDDNAERVDVLTLIRDHVVAEEVYLLSETDLQFGDLLPDNVRW